MNKLKSTVKLNRNNFNKYHAYDMDIQKNKFVAKKNDKSLDKQKEKKPISQIYSRNKAEKSNKKIKKSSSSTRQKIKRPVSTSNNRQDKHKTLSRPKSSKKLKSHSKQSKTKLNGKSNNGFENNVPMHRNELNKLFDKKKTMKKESNLKKKQIEKINKKNFEDMIMKKKEINKQQQLLLDQKHIHLQQFVTQVPAKEEDINFQSHQPQLIPADPKQTYYISQIVKSFMIQKGMAMARDHLITSLQMLQFLKTIRKPQQHQIKKLQLTKLDKYQDKRTIVFDLDQTLIHCNQRTDLPCDAILPIIFPTKEIINAGINVRPYAIEIIKKLYQQYQLIIFTASHSCYANKVIDFIDPDKKYFSHRLFREHCWQTPQGLYIKDLRVINRNLKDMILIDNAIYSYYFQLENGVPIIPYYEGKLDAQLLSLMNYLSKIDKYDDIRKYNCQILKINKYMQYDDPVSLISQLYPQQIETQQTLLNIDQ